MHQFMKPRCIYSLSVVSKMKAPLPPPNYENVVSTGVKSQVYISFGEDRFLDAMESFIFLCGMASLDHDDPCHGVFFFDTSTDCDLHVKAEFYVPGIELNRKKLCCHCAGICDSLIELNSSLKAVIGPYIFGGPLNLYDVP